MNLPKNGNVLVVDDELDVLNPLAEFIAEWGYNVVTTTSAKQALYTLKNQNFDLLLTDLVMPEMDGIRLLQSALEIDPLLIGIIITGQGTIKTAIEAMKLGAFDYILKPIDWKTLSPVIFRAMNVRRLREAEQKYRSIVEDYQTELICRFLPNNLLTFVNKAFCRYFNKEPGQMIGWSFLPLIYEEDRDIVTKHLSSISYDNPVSSIEYRVLNPEGKICWQNWTTSALFDRNQNIIEFQSIGRDITDRKRVEEALKESEEKYRSLVENANEAIVVAQDGLLKFVNPMAVKITGYSFKELTSVPFTNFLHPADRDWVFSNYLRRLRGERLPDKYSFRLIDKKGNVKWVEISAVLFLWEGRPATLNFLTDITERKEAEDKLKLSYEQISKLSMRLAEVEEAEKQKLAHELHDRVGQDLTALAINLNIMRSQLPEIADKSFVSRLDDSILLLQQASEQMRDVMSELRPAVLDDYGLLSVIRWYGEKFSKRTGIDLIIEAEDTSQRLSRTKELTLFRITQEALTNVAKHAHAKKVTIQMKEKNGSLLLIISDDGKGFELKMKKDKKGWGLFTMQERARSIGGNFSIESEINKGTKIIIEVPINN